MNFGGRVEGQVKGRLVFELIADEVVFLTGEFIFTNNKKNIYGVISSSYLKYIEFSSPL